MKDKIQRVSDIEDIISEKLPESVISLILRSLPPKDMVQTSVLSTKWINRWTTSITNLDFHNTDLSYNCTQLCSFCNNEYYTNDLALPMPCRVGANRHVVNSELPLTFSLPLLKKFYIKDCTWPVGKDLIVQAPLLEIISIEDNGFCNCNDTSHVETKQSITFNAKHLKKFTYSGCGFTLVHLFHHNFISLDYVKIVLNKCEQSFSETKLLHFLLSLFQQTCHLKSIKLEGFFNLQVLIKADMPTFSMLTKLKLGLTSLEVLLCFLQNSPVLKILTIKGLHYFTQEFLNSVDVPHCLASSLEIVKFTKINAEKHELILAKYFLVKCMMMKLLRVSFAEQKSNKSKKAVKEFAKTLFHYKRDDVSISLILFRFGIGLTAI